jgi:hypothetical protein
MDHVVKVELVDLAGIEANEAVTHMLEQLPQLRPVILGDHLSRRSPLGLVALALGVTTPGHIGTLHG